MSIYRYKGRKPEFAPTASDSAKPVEPAELPSVGSTIDHKQKKAVAFAALSSDTWTAWGMDSGRFFHLLCNSMETNSGETVAAVMPLICREHGVLLTEQEARSFFPEHQKWTYVQPVSKDLRGNRSERKNP